MVKIEEQEMALAVVDWMAERAGEHFTVARISQIFGRSPYCTRQMLEDLFVAGKIRKAIAKSCRYYVADLSQLQAEERARQQVAPKRPLKVEKHRIELYARIAEYRTAMPSIG